MAFEADLTRNDVMQKLAIPFVSGKQFFCGGVIVQAGRVEEIRVSETQQDSSELVPMIKARRNASRVTSATPAAWQLIYDGRDITREILDEANNSVQTEQPIRSESPTFSDRVFIVHGHDNGAVDQTELLLRRFGLTPIILRNEPNAGRTVIEKFEANTDVGFAIVLLTPDDLGGIKIESLSPRARQNVIWEWGYLVAQLGRERVVCLYKGDVEMPSDLDGLVTVRVGDDIRSSTEEIRRELTAAGYHLA